MLSYPRTVEIFFLYILLPSPGIFHRVFLLLLQFLNLVRYSTYMAFDLPRIILQVQSEKVLENLDSVI